MFLTLQKASPNASFTADVRVLLPDLPSYEDHVPDSYPSMARVAENGMVLIPVPVRLNQMVGWVGILMIFEEHWKRHCTLGKQTQPLHVEDSTGTEAACSFQVRFLVPPLVLVQHLWFFV